jgi:rhamnogalacturonyl hydrolase YesR
MTGHASLETIEALAVETMRYPFKVWGFGEGIALEALWEADAAVPHLNCRAFVLDLFEKWLARPIAEPDHSAPGMLFVGAYHATGDRRYLDRARLLARHMLDLPRTSHGAALHRPTHADFHDYLYVDCMEVDGPFLCKLGVVPGDSAFVDAGVAQLLSYCEILQDTQTGLFYHQYNALSGQVNGAFWGRGNGWALLGLIKTLMLLPKDHDFYDDIAGRFQRLASALATRQLPDGGWPTVLDNPETYEESSLAAMFGLGFQLGVTHGVLDSAFQVSADLARQRTAGRLSGGVLVGVSVGTPPGNAAHYAGIQTGGGFPWGQGPALALMLQRRN